FMGGGGILKTVLLELFTSFLKIFSRMEAEKQRVLVLNKQHLFETEKDGKWITQAVKPAPANMKPGIYLLHTAKSPQDSVRYEGQIVFQNDSYVYQKTRQSIVKYPCSLFSSVPSIGEVVSISVKDKAATVEKAGIGEKKTLTR
ncbi:TPA: KfrB domain-containing protein, partial [Neisseria gonorrhoeae]